MAQDAQLLLKVGLDLSTFRNQLATLGQAAAGYNLPIKLKFDRTVIKNELNSLRQSLGRQKFNVELNIVGGLTKDQFEKIQGRLDALSKTKAVEIPVSIRSAVTQKDVSSVVADINKTIKGSSALESGGGKIRIGTSIKPSITQADVREFKKAVTESLGGISVNVKASVQGGKGGVPPGFPDLMEYMRTQGMVGKTASGMEMRMRNEPGGGQLERVLDTFARGVFRMLGMDPAVIRAQEAEKRRLPPINWEAIVPPARGVRTASTMALAPGRAFPQLPGSAFAEQKRLVGDILNPALKEALRNAANAFVDAVRNGLNAAVREVQVRDLGTAGRPTLGGGRVAGLLPAGVGRTASPYATGALGRDGETRAEMLARREREARMRSALREVDVMGGGAGRAPSPYSQSYRAARSLSAIVPYQAPGALVAAGGGGGGGGGGAGGAGGGGGGRRPSGGGDVFGGLGRLSLPGAGTIRELGSEFAFATKQVLLFGQAYKLLAFVQDFPGQVGQAVGQLQSFRNTLNAISPSAAEAAKSNEFILSIVDKYNVPIQSARDGFTKLYASMEPAGFRGEEIRGLFESISMGAATFGMSADKVDRVIYAFSQMASKGQVMSEELKGQLGDVLPGSMALFAEAAGFKGPDAISKFSEALEDGVYKGQNMVKLLKNVRVVMEQEFGPGAEGAARTFQGGINRMQNSLRQLYEAFEPVAVNFMNQVVKPLTDGLRTAADGFTAFLQGVAAKTPQGAAFAQELERLRPALEGIGNNLKGLLPTFELFGNILLNVGKLLLAIAGNPVTGFLLKVYANVLLVNTVFSLLGGKILVGLVSNIGAAIARFIALNIQMGLLQKTTAVANSSLAGTQLQMALLTRNAGAALGPIGLLKTALMGLARIGLIAIAIQVVIDGMAEIDRLKKSLDDIAGFSSKEYKKQVQGLSREEVNSRIIVNRRSQAQARKDLQEFTGPVGAAKGLMTGRDEELRARLVKYQIQEAVLQGARGNKTQSQLMQSQLGGALQPVTGGGEGGGKDGTKGAADEAAKKAARLAEEIARQAMAASDALFSERQRLLVMQQTNPIAKAFAQYTSQELTIQRELNQALKDAKGEKEKADLRETARLKQSANALELEQEMKRAREDALAPIEDLLKGQREQLRYEKDVTDLLQQGMLPERAKQVAEVRKLVRTQLESLDLSIKNARAAITEAEARGASADQIERLKKALEDLEKARGGIEGKGKEAEAGVPKEKEAKSPLDYIKEGAASAQAELAKLTNWGYQAVEAGKAIGSAFGTAFKDLISGSASAQEALAGMMQSIADHFLDMAAQIIAQQITMMIYGIILKALGVMGGAAGGGASSNAAGFGGSFDAGIAPLPNVPDYSGAFKFANGGIATGGFVPFKAFANGGMVAGPTLGLVGEGKYNEAIVPLPDGRSIPVQLQDGSIRDKMGSDTTGAGGSPMLSMSFQSTTINGVEYVDRAQLEAAMAETRRISVREGATRGATIALDKLANSPSSRRRVGLR